MNGDDIALDDEYLIVKGFFYALILIYASYKDIKEKIIPDKVHIMIMLVSLIKINIMSAILGFIIVPLPFFITALLKGDGIGGGDVKLMAASGFFLGLKAGFIASIIGLTLAVAINFIYYKIKNKDKNISFPLAPYLSIGCFLSYLITGGC
ncbi:prepilin peptidase [Clostridium sp. ZS2-4]|uniref:prepilin peptidase n=1 Tax=Clostridium sp. ZS2-4 TaxID=2987703 RepID=UPI00227C7147|nr:A24 family peptidase [Clostridium sp. ZS2-4]MCY6356216.1 A24 family peptidase [Clostridium sp. ZS2-4]